MSPISKTMSSLKSSKQNRERLPDVLAQPNDAVAARADALPMTVTGKVIRKELKARAMAEMAA